MITSISSVDGRYASKTIDLEPYFSEYGLIFYRVKVEILYLIAFLDEIERPLADTNKKVLYEIVDTFGEEDALAVKEIEKTTNHDVKAVEYFIADKLEKLGLQSLKPWVHFALTSEDTNNLAYSLMVNEARNDVLVPKMQGIIDELTEIARDQSGTVMLARTHGQSASPTTFGKEVAVFVSRLSYHLDEFRDTSIRAKIAGATGNYNAHMVAFPSHDWTAFAKKFVESFGLEHNPLVTQIENHDSFARVFDAIKRFNTVLIGFDQDMWRYISDNYIGQKRIENEVGSSTMPHKVNPIDFENSEGNLGLANSGFEFLSSKLLISRLQRDLTDSTVVRNIGVYFAHSLLGYKSLQKGLSKIEIHREVMKQDVFNHPEVLAEAIQTILRREGISDAYELLKELTRGESVTLAGIQKWVRELDIDEGVKAEMLGLTPEGYIGLAGELVEIMQ